MPVLVMSVGVGEPKYPAVPDTFIALTLKDDTEFVNVDAIVAFELTISVLVLVIPVAVSEDTVANEETKRVEKTPRVPPPPPGTYGSPLIDDILRLPTFAVGVLIKLLAYSDTELIVFVERLLVLVDTALTTLAPSAPVMLADEVLRAPPKVPLALKIPLTPDTLPPAVILVAADTIPAEVRLAAESEPPKIPPPRAFTEVEAFIL